MPRKRIFLLFLGLFILLLGSTYAVLDRTGAAHGFALEHLSKVLRSKFSLDRTGLDLAEGTLTLEGLEVARPGAAEEEAPMVSVDKVQLGVETNPLGDFINLREVRITGWELNLNLVAGELPNLSELLALPELEGSDSLGKGAPPIVVTESLIRLRLAPDQPALVFDQVHLELLPESPGSAQMALRGELRSDAGFVMQVRGSADLGTNDYRVLLSAEDIPLESGLVRRFQPGLEDMFREAQVQGTLSKVSFWFESGTSGTPPGEPPVEANGAAPDFAAGVVAELAAVDCVIPAAPLPIRNASGKLHLTSREGGLLRFELAAGSEAAGRINLLGRLGNLTETVEGTGSPDYELEATIAGLPVDEQLREAVTASPDGARVWNAFRASGGTIDARASFSGTLEPADGGASGNVPKVAADVTLNGISAAFHGFATTRLPRIVAFPLPMRGLSGEVQVRGNMIYVNQLTAEIAAGAAAGSPVSFNGWVDAMRPDGGETIYLDILAERVAFDQPTRDALSTLLTNPGEAPEGERLFAEYNPEGFASLAVRLRDERNPVDKGWQVAIKPLGASCTFERFPIRVENVTGELRIDGRGVGVEFLAERDGSAVRVQGEALYQNIQDTGAGSLGIWVEAERVALDDDLRHALEVFRPALRDRWDELRPTGSTAATVALWRDPGESLYTYDVQVELAGARLDPVNSPLLLEDLYGPILIHGRDDELRADFNGLSGRLYNGGDGDAAELFVLGAVEAIGGPDGSTTPNKAAITAVVQKLALGPRLAQTLDQAGIFDQDVWDLLKPSGTVDMVLNRTLQSGDADAHNDLEILLRDVGLDTAVLPGPARGLRGRISVRDDLVRFRQLQCQMLDATVSVEGGELRRDGEQLILTSTVNSPKFPVDDRMARLLTGPFRDSYLARRLAGHVAIDELNVELTFGPDGDQDQLLKSRFSGEFAAIGLAFDLGTRVTDCNGRWRVEDAQFGSGSGSMAGTLEDISLTALGHYADQLRADFVADDRAAVFKNLSTSLHGGRITGADTQLAPGDAPTDSGALVYEYAAPGRLQADLRVSGLDLRSLLASAGSGTDAKVSGSLGGRLTIDQLLGDDFVELGARGALELADANLGDVPLFTAFYSVMKPERRPVFDGARIAFEVANRRIGFSEFSVTSPLLSVNGKGSMGMDGYVDLEFRVPALLGNAADFFIVPTTINSLIEEALRVHIHGYIHSLRADLKSFLQQDPGRQPVRPLPPQPRSPTPGKTSPE